MSTAVLRSEQGGRGEDTERAGRAEEMGSGRILSTAQRDFHAYRWKNRRLFRNLLRSFDRGARKRSKIWRLGRTG